MPVNSMETNTEPTFGNFGMLSSVLGIFQYCNTNVSISIKKINYWFGFLVYRPRLVEGMIAIKLNKGFLLSLIMSVLTRGVLNSH